MRTIDNATDTNYWELKSYTRKC